MLEIESGLCFSDFLLDKEEYIFKWFIKLKINCYLSYFTSFWNKIMLFDQMSKNCSIRRHQNISSCYQNTQTKATLNLTQRYDQLRYFFQFSNIDDFIPPHKNFSHGYRHIE